MEPWKPIQELSSNTGRSRRFLILFAIVIALGRFGILTRGPIKPYISDDIYGCALAALSVLLIVTAHVRLGILGRVVAACTSGVIATYGIDLLVRNAYTSGLLVLIIAYIGLTETGSTT